MMKKLLVVLIFTFALCSFSQENKVRSGIEVLRDQNFQLLEGKRVGLITNASGIDSELKSTVDILFEAENVNLTSLFGPEHGVRGNIEGGLTVEQYTDEYTGLPVYSLYGQTRKPTEAMLKDVDVLVYDIQDVGCRSYTFISSMGMIMEAAAEFGKEVVILDRPNPLGGNRVEGNLTEDGFISFISQFKIPYVYGLTCGELAELLNEEGMLSNGAKCDLKVVRMDGWKREMTFEDTGLPWVLTSPHIPHNYSPFFYVCSGIVGELRDAFSIGVGYTLPFQTFAAEWIDGIGLAKEMNSFGLNDVHFRPIYYIPYYAFGKGKNLSGVQIYITDYKKVNLMEIQFYFIQALINVYPDRNIFDGATESQLRAFDKALGTDYVRTSIQETGSVNAAIEYINKDSDNFKTLSSKYYFYN